MSLADWDLPWPALKVPPYRACSLGDWRMWQAEQIEQFGYFQDWRGRGSMFVLSRGDISWMSSARDEIDSQAPHVAAAYGHTVIMGAGMGIALYNLLDSPRVDRVTLVERDPSVLELLEAAAGLSRWPGVEKLRVELVDALAYSPHQAVDSLYADIWAMPGEPQTIREMQSIQQHVRAAQVGWWGQEIHYLQWLAAGAEPSLASYQAWAQELGLPLIEQNNPAYSAAVARVAGSYCYRSFLQDPVRNLALASA